MIEDDLLTKAVSRIRQRAEKQEDVHKLVEAFVDVGIAQQLDNRNSQIFYGRRGTGKTHVLFVLRERLRSESEQNAVVYIDARTLGSTTQFTDTTLSLRVRCLALFKDILGEVQSALTEQIIERPSKRAEEALKANDELANLIVEPVTSFRTDTIAYQSSGEQAKDVSGKMGINLSKGSLSADAGTARSARDVRSESVHAVGHAEAEDKIIFPALSKALSRVLELADCHLYILIDEWSSLPADIQPYLAEFLKRSVLPVSRATIKLASLEYRSHFSTSDKDTLVGFEVGPDIAATQDLDDYYVFDRNPGRLTQIYADMLLRHLGSELPENYLRDSYGITTGSQLASKLFTQGRAFGELARAAEGVVRDLICIFSMAYFDAKRRGRDDIDQKAIIDAARQWFEQDKHPQLDAHLSSVLQRIVSEVIGERKARSFLLPRDLEKNAVVQRLFDARVVHPMQRGYADKDNPGVRYNIYALDYGTYVDLLGTSKEPQIDLVADAKEEREGDSVVPFDDKRSIRRIVLRPEVLQ